MMAAVTGALTSVIASVGEIVTSIMTGGALAELLPLFAIGIAISLFGFGIRAIRSLVWGA